MAVKENSLAHVLRFKGLFDFQEVYHVVHQWLETRGFEVHETKHKNVVKQTGFERDITWTAWRRVTEYYSWWVNVEMHGWDISEVEVMRDGQKKIMWKGRFYFRIHATFELDYSSRFGDTPLKKNVVTFLNRYVFRRMIYSMWEDKLRFKMYEFMNAVKDALDVQAKGNESQDMYVRGRESMIGFKPGGMH